MIQCKNCELYVDGSMTCNPAENIKEEACVLKWQLLVLDNLDRKVEESNAFTLRMAPRMEKLLEAQEREAAEKEGAERWKHGGADGNERIG